MPGDGRGLIDAKASKGLFNNEATTQTSTWAAIGSTILGTFPQETLDLMLSGANGKTMFWVGLAISVVKFVNFKTLFGK